MTEMSGDDGLRDDLAVMLAWWQRIATDVSPTEAADRILALLEVAALRAKAAAADRVRAMIVAYDDGEPWAASIDRIRRALDDSDRTDRGRC